MPKAKTIPLPTSPEGVANQEYELVSIDSLKPHPKNPRIGNVDVIVQSIKRNGFYGGVVVQRSTRYILAGNHRSKAARKAGITEVPVLWIDCDDATATRILLADNRTNDMAEYDNAALTAFLSELADAGDLLGTGYNQDALDDMLAAQDKAGADENKDDPSAANSPVISYSIVFEDVDQQQTWFEFLKRLRKHAPESTIAQRVIEFILDHPEEAWS